MKKVFISLVVSVFIVASISPAYGDITGISSFSDVLNNLIYWCLTPTTAGEGEDEIVAAREYVNSVWRTPGNCDGTVEVTYQSLSDAVISMNSSGIPCKIAMWRGAGSTGYVIKATGSIPICDGATTVDVNGKYFTNISGAVFIAKNNTSGVVTSEQIDSIKEILNNFYDLFNTNSGLGRSIYRIENAVSGLYVDIHNSVMGSIDSLLTTCNTISTKLDTLISVISNGKVLVDNSDVVTAIQSIPAFDDTKLLSGLSALGATAARIADAIDYNFGQYSGTHVFPSLAAGQYYVYGDKAELFEDITGEVLYSSSSRLTTDSYTLDYADMTRKLSVRAYPTFAQYTLELFSDTRPTTPITISNITYHTLLGASRSRDSVVYPAAWKYSSVVNKFYAVTGFNVYYKDDPEQYPVSTSASAFENPYVYGFSADPVDVVFSSRFTAFQQLENTRLINAFSASDYTAQLTAVTDKLDALANKPAADLTNIESALSTISDKLDNTASDVNNTIINITNDNDYFSVFYITDGDGNTQSVTDFAGDLTGASGKLLSLLYRLVFSDALDSVDSDLGNIEDFFTSEEPPVETTALDGDTAPANEVIDVWDT